MTGRSKAVRWFLVVGSLCLGVDACADEPAEDLLLRCPLEPGRTQASLHVDGQLRRVSIEVGPRVENDHPAPVVFLWHGWGGDAAGLLDGLQVGRAWPEAVFVAPEGLPRSLLGAQSRSLPGWQLRAGELGDRDLALFDALVERLEPLECLDSQRFVSSGFSNGGYFSNLLGCRRGEVLAAIAPVSGGGPFERCAAPVAAWIAHGRSDRVVPPGEGRASFARWQERNGCAPSEDGADACVEAAGCRREAVYCAFPGGHVWPVALTQRWKRFLERQRRGASANP